MDTETTHPNWQNQIAASTLSSDANFPPEENDEFSLLDLLILFGERKWFILAVVGVSIAVGTAIALFTPPRYIATVTLLPPQRETSMSSLLASQLGSAGGVAALAGAALGVKNPNDTVAAMFRSRTVEDAMVQHFGLMQEYHKQFLSDARKSFEKYASVDTGVKDGLIRISVNDRNPRRAAELANGYVDQFRVLSDHLAITEAAQRRLFFEEQLEQAKDNLAKAEQAFKSTEEATGMIQLDSQTRALIESAASLRAQIAAKQVQIQGMETYATGENSQLVQAQQELQGMRTQLAALGGSGDSANEGLFVPQTKVPQAGLEYIRSLRDVKYYETIFDILARQFEVAKLDEAKQGAVIQVVDPAVPPDKKSTPQRGLILMLSTLVGLFLGPVIVILGAWLKQFQRDSATYAKLQALRRALFLRKARSNT